MTNGNQPEHSARRELHSETVASLPASGIRRFFELLDEATGVISLAVGQPDFATPAQITNAASEAMLAGHTGYTSNYGVPELREMLSRQIERLYGVHYDPNGELMLTSGVSEALDIAMRALVDPGDEVLVPEPAYVAYQPVVLLAGGRYVPVPTDPEHSFMVTAAALEQRITPATKAILLEAMMKVHQYVMMCAPTAAQYAAIEALTSGEEDVRGMVAEYDRRRRLVVGRLREIGLPTVEPRGAFYAFPDIRSTGLDDLAFAEALLEEERVAMVPGSAFGESGRGFVRICYAADYDDIEEAMDRTARFVARRQARAAAK